MGTNDGVSADGRTVAAALMLDIYTASDLLAATKSALDAGGDIAIDLGDAVLMHSAAVQVLVAAVQAARASDRSVRFVGISTEVAAMWNAAGLDALLIMPEASRDLV